LLPVVRVIVLLLLEKAMLLILTDGIKCTALLKLVVFIDLENVSFICVLTGTESPCDGIDEIIFGASSLSSGVYFYKLTSGEFTESKKMILVK